MTPSPLPQPTPFTCPHCGAGMDVQREVCPRCGAQVKDVSYAVLRLPVFIEGVLLLGVVVFGALVLCMALSTADIMATGRFEPFLLVPMAGFFGCLYPLLKHRR